MAGKATKTTASTASSSGSDGSGVADRTTGYWRTWTLTLPRSITIPVPASPAVVLIPFLLWSALALSAVCMVHMYAFYWKNWLVDPASIESIALDALKANPDGNLTAIFQHVVHDLQRTYPGHILPVDLNRDWIFINGMSGEASGAGDRAQ
ncbi:hypothetical protein HDU93_004508 [Gonapodya sp. JEL0774]|nr:hypothetical protein HDU93_004508 [Gonapodya sp. JEL0774]